MSTNTSDSGFLKPSMLGRWIAERFDIWQMRFLSDNELGRVASDRGLMSLSLGDGIKQLWQLSLLCADLVSSTEQLDVQGLDFIEQDDEGRYYYSDNRQPQPDENGFGGAIARLNEFPPHIGLYFHPFRYYVLYHLDRVLDLRIHPMQMLLSVDNYLELLNRQIRIFQQWTSREDFSQLVKLGSANKRWVKLPAAAGPRGSANTAPSRRSASAYAARLTHHSSPRSTASPDSSAAAR